MAAAPLTVDYAAHPAFPHDVEPLPCPADTVASFGARYERLAANGTGAATAADWAHLMAEGDSVLAQMEGASSDPLQQLFLQELRRLLASILREQRDYYLDRDPALRSDWANPGTRQLMERRFFVGQLPDEVTTTLREIAQPQIEEFQARAEAGALTRGDLSTGQGPTVKRLTRTLNSAFRENGTLDSVSAYTGRPMVTAGLALELSDHRSTWWQHKLPTSEQPRTMYAHLDETISVPKAIVYLTDVESGSGQTSCYPGLLDEMHLTALQDLLGRAVSVVMEPPSQLPSVLGDGVYHQALGSAALRRLFMALPEELRFNSHLGWDVLPGSALEEHMLRIEEPLLGAAGRHIVFDGGRLFHRGGLIEHGQRVAMQVLFRSREETRLLNKVRGRVRRLTSGGAERA